MDKRLVLLKEIEIAVGAMRAAVECADYKEIVDWGITVQIRTSELAVTVMPEIRNMPDYS